MLDCLQNTRKLDTLLVTYEAMFILIKVKVKQSLYTPWRRLGGEEV
jgi:hypothetical protein